MFIFVPGPRDGRPGYGYEYHIRSDTGTFYGTPNPDGFEEGKGCPGTPDPYHENPRPTTCDQILDGGRYVKGSCFTQYGDTVELVGGGVEGIYVEFNDAPTVTNGQGIPYVEIGDRRYTSLADLSNDYKILNPDGTYKACYDDADCPGKNVCEGNACVGPCEGVACPPGEECVDGECRSAGGVTPPDIPERVVAGVAVGVGLGVGAALLDDRR